MDSSGSIHGTAQEPFKVVLLVETSPAMLSRWPDIRQHYVPLLLNALPTGSSSMNDSVSLAIVPMRDSEDYSSESPSLAHFTNTDVQLANLRTLDFQSPASPEALLPALKRSIQLLLQSGKNLNSLKYLIIAVTCWPEHATQRNSFYENIPRLEPSLEPFVPLLVENCIRTSLILPPKKRSTSLSDVFDYTVQHQTLLPNPPWFEYNARKYQFYLSGFVARSEPIFARSRRTGSQSEQVSPTDTARSSRALHRRRSASPPFRSHRTSTAPSVSSGSSHSSGSSSGTTQNSNTTTRGPRKLGLVNDLRQRFGFKPSTEEPPPFLRSPSPTPQELPPEPVQPATTSMLSSEVQGLVRPDGRFSMTPSSSVNYHSSAMQAPGHLTMHSPIISSILPTSSLQRDNHMSYTSPTHPLSPVVITTGHNPEISSPVGSTGLYYDMSPSTTGDSLARREASFQDDYAHRLRFAAQHSIRPAPPPPPLNMTNPPMPTYYPRDYYAQPSPSMATPSSAISMQPFSFLAPQAIHYTYPSLPPSMDPFAFRRESDILHSGEQTPVARPAPLDPRYHGPSPVSSLYGWDGK